MTEEYLTIEELSARLKQDPKTIRALVTEVALQMTKEYLTIEELAQRLAVEERTIKNKMATGIFKKGIHYFKPKGLHPRFKWTAIVAWLEAKEEAAGVRESDAIPMARGYLLGKGNKSSGLLTR